MMLSQGTLQTTNPMHQSGLLTHKVMPFEARYLVAVVSSAFDY